MLSHGTAPAVTDDPPADELPGGTWLGRHQITRLVGRGGMGNVYEAFHRDLGKRVAVKTLLPALAASAESRARFVREGQAAARIRHPHVVDVTDVVSQGAVTYLVMEYLEGEDLAARIARQGTLSVRETADIMLPVVAAIAAAHEHGVIHRDLKPENVFLVRASRDDGAGFPKVVDFGISKLLGDPGAAPLTATSTSFGTLYYLPPEQLRGARDADARSDQYALATIIYECLTGRRAFDGDGIYGILKSVAEGTHAPARTLRSDLPPEVDAAIERALSLDPAARFASVGMLGASLLAFASPGVRARWQGVCAAPAEPELPAELAPEPRTPPRTPSATLILPAGNPITAEIATAPVVPARSWTPRLILVGIAIAAASVAIASARRYRVAPTVEAAPHEPPPPAVPSPPPAAVTAPPAPASAVAPAPVPAAVLSVPRSVHRRPIKRRHSLQPLAPSRNSAPIID